MKRRLIFGITVALAVASSAFLGCATSKAPTQLARSSPFRKIQVGMEKADILRSFGAPDRIDIVENRKFRYTYIDEDNARVTLLFDESNRVIEIGGVESTQISAAAQKPAEPSESPAPGEESQDDFQQ